MAHALLTVVVFNKDLKKNRFPNKNTTLSLMLESWMNRSRFSFVLWRLM
jgi:hypothetical protein